jgi:subtilisin family serine protease
MSTSKGRSRPRLSHISSAVIACLVAASSAAAGLNSKTPTPAPQTLTSFKPAMLPLGISDAPRTFVLQLADDPIAAVAGKAGGPLSAQQKSRIKTALKQQQAPVSQRVQALGGKVLAGYQAAYNGLKVRIPARQAAALAAIPGVVAVRPLRPFKRTNVHGVPLVGGPAVWGGVPGYRGEGIKIADIDTGIDYTHADFGGPGTVAAYQAALASDTTDPDPTLVGPSAPKVKGGIDLVGDDYNADSSSPAYQPTPHPDSNPLDCNGHGTHTAGTIAGFGVLSDGTRYTGTYDADTVSAHSWKVGPGVAPLADLYAVRVFGCEGSTDEVIDAIEWAVDNDMDVINMSLGSPFGSADDPTAAAASNAAWAGVIVIASAGNEGPAPYIVGSPSTGKGVVSVAASDPTPSFPAAALALSTGTTVQAIDADGVPVNGQTLPVKVLYSGTPHDAAHISLGCDSNEYAGSAGFLVVVKRGTCARVARAVFGQKAGAAAVLMVNNADTFPPYEGPITGNPDTGETYTVTIPFLGVPSGKGADLVAADGGTAALSDATIANPGYLVPASFTSGGPRGGDSSLRPWLTAPGVSIASAGVGSGSDPLILSGTSMAAPHTTGAAALVKQAHPDWKISLYYAAALANTADPGLVKDYSARIAGGGLLQAPAATQTDVVALGFLSYGFAELDHDFSQTRRVKLRNLGSQPASFTVSTANAAGSPHTVGLSKTNVVVPPHGVELIDVKLQVPAASAGDSSAFNDVTGLLVFTPAAGSNHDVTLRLPYYFVPQAVSHIDTKLDVLQLRRHGSAEATVTNKKGASSGSADWYAWGLSDGADSGLGGNDAAAVGVQAFPGLLAFAIKTRKRWSNAAAYEFDVLVDVDGDGSDDYDVVGIDYGAITSGDFNGQLATAVFDLRSGSGSIAFLADAPLDSSTLVLPVLISQLCQSGSPCLSASNPRFKYHAATFGLIDGSSDTIRGTASFNAFTPAISTGMYDTLAPGSSTSETVTIDAGEWKLTPPLGLMIVSHDNPSKDEAQLIRVR